MILEKGKIFIISEHRHKNNFKLYTITSVSKEIVYLSSDQDRIAVTKKCFNKYYSPATETEILLYGH